MPDSFLTELAKPQPDPGGGAAAAHGALIGLALLKKVFHLEYARAQQKNQALNSWEIKENELFSLSDRIRRLREEDRQIYPRLIQEKKSNSDKKALLRIIEDSIAVPLRIMEAVKEGLTILFWVGARCRKNLKADLLVTAEFLGAALQGAFYIGQANLPLVQEVSVTRAFEQELGDTLQEGMRAFKQVMEILSP
jgi:formiminotetrahydrofolate cyclodeaminase